MGPGTSECRAVEQLTHSPSSTIQAGCTLFPPSNLLLTKWIHLQCQVLFPLHMDKSPHPLTPLPRLTLLHFSTFLHTGIIQCKTCFFAVRLLWWCERGLCFCFVTSLNVEFSVHPSCPRRLKSYMFLTVCKTYDSFANVIWIGNFYTLYISYDFEAHVCQLLTTLIGMGLKWHIITYNDNWKRLELAKGTHKFFEWHS